MDVTAAAMPSLGPSPKDAASSGSVRALVDGLLTECIRQDASDLHLAPNLPAYLRVEGVLEPQTDRPLITADDTARITDYLIGDLDRGPLDSSGSVDGAITGPGGIRFRFNVFRRQGAISIALRRLEDRFRSLEELGLPDELYRLCDLPDGLIVVAGPTGCGKSTSLATMLDRINQTRPCHMITIEDPIEYLHTTAKALVNQRQVGTDTAGFYEALVASLREDPDVILVGEIRDLNTIRTAIVAAETGHLVFTTVHAGDCVGAIERLVSVFPADEQDGIRRQLSLVLRAIVAQHLLVADGPTPNGHSGLRSADAVQRRSRVVASEVLLVNPAVANLIATAKSNQIYSAMETGTGMGMQTLEQDLARLWVAGRISETTAVAMARNPNILRERAARMRRPAAIPSVKGRP
jgi:twitching motility protein PilT